MRPMTESLLKDQRPAETTGGILRERLAIMEQKNPRFSLRAMARLLESSPSYLSELIHGKKTVSPSKAMVFAKQLQLSQEDTEYFCTLAQYETAETPSVKASLWERLEYMRPGRVTRRYEHDQFRVLSEWYHIPILELTEVSGFDFKPLNIARRLGITVAEAVGAVERLQQTGLLRIDEKGSYVKAHPQGRFESVERNEALRTFHGQMLDKAKQAVAHQPPNARLVGSETMAIDPRDLPKVEAILRRALAEISTINRKSSSKSAVYHLGVQCFSLTK